MKFKLTITAAFIAIFVSTLTALAANPYTVKYFTCYGDVEEGETTWREICEGPDGGLEWNHWSLYWEYCSGSFEVKFQGELKDGQPWNGTRSYEAKCMRGEVVAIPIPPTSTTSPTNPPTIVPPNTNKVITLKPAGSQWRPFLVKKESKDIWSLWDLTTGVGVKVGTFVEGNIPEQNQFIVGNGIVDLYRLATGEYQVNIHWNNKMDVAIAPSISQLSKVALH